MARVVHVTCSTKQTPRECRLQIKSNPKSRPGEVVDEVERVIPKRSASASEPKVVRLTSVMLASRPCWQSITGLQYGTPCGRLQGGGPMAAVGGGCVKVKKMVGCAQ